MPDIRAMRMLVLGASGQIGYPVLLRLARDFPAAMISGTSRSGKAPGGYLGSNLSFQAFDPFQDDWAALGRADVVINCIGQIRATRDCPFEQIHMGLTQQLLAHRAAMGHPRIIQVSALGAGAHADVPFLATKAAADQLLLEAGNAHIVRPSIVCSPDTMLVRKLRQLHHIGRRLGGYLPVPAGFLDTRIQPVRVEDVAALIAALIRNSKAPTLIPAVGPEAISMGELLALLDRGRAQPLNIRPFPRAWAALLVRYVAQLFFPHLINEDQFRLLFADNTGEQETLRSLLGRAPGDTRGFWEGQLK